MRKARHPFIPVEEAKEVALAQSLLRLGGSLDCIRGLATALGVLARGRIIFQRQHPARLERSLTWIWNHSTRATGRGGRRRVGAVCNLAPRPHPHPDRGHDVRWRRDTGGHKDIGIESTITFELLHLQSIKAEENDETS